MNAAFTLARDARVMIDVLGRFGDLDTEAFDTQRHKRFAVFRRPLSPASAASSAINSRLMSCCFNASSISLVSPLVP